MCISGLGGERNLEEARKHVKEAANKGHIRAQNLYAWMCRNASGGGIDLEEARKHYKQLADLHDDVFAESLYISAQMDLNLLNNPKSEEIYRKDAKEIFMSAAYRYAEICQTMKGEENLLETRKYMALAASNGHAQAKDWCDRVSQIDRARGVDPKSARKEGS